MLKLSATPQHPPINCKTPLALAYSEIQKKLELHQQFHFLSKLQSPKSGNKAISSKMRAKLLNWLEKLALHTFNFSTQTLITASSIIDQYLVKTNQPPTSLQLIGCAGLLIASKLKESVIVDPECYVTASCSVFSMTQLLQKQRTIYGCMEWKKLRRGVLYGVRLGSELLNMHEQVRMIEPFLWSCVKDEQIGSWKQAKVVYAVLSAAVIDSQHKPSTAMLDLLRHF